VTRVVASEPEGRVDPHLLVVVEHREVVAEPEPLLGRRTGAPKGNTQTDS
jgi:hypothetical protein